MLFNSYIFIFLFLPVTLLLWYLCNRLKRYKLAQFIIVVLSLVFYSYYNWKDAIVILFSIVVTGVSVNGWRGKRGM